MKSKPAGAVCCVAHPMSQAAAQRTNIVAARRALRSAGPGFAGPGRAPVKRSGATERRQLDPLVVVLQDLLVVAPAKGHTLRAPLRHAHAVAEALAVEHEAVRQLVDVPA